MPESSFEETMETSECNATAEVDNCRANDRTMDVTAGIGCQVMHENSIHSLIFLDDFRRLINGRKHGRRDHDETSDAKATAL